MRAQPLVQRPELFYHPPDRWPFTAGRRGQGALARVLIRRCAAPCRSRWRSRCGAMSSACAWTSSASRGWSTSAGRRPDVPSLGTGTDRGAERCGFRYRFPPASIGDPDSRPEPGQGGLILRPNFYSRTWYLDCATPRILDGGQRCGAMRETLAGIHRGFVDVDPLKWRTGAR
jgi:hypothetical protein